MGTEGDEDVSSLYEPWETRVAGFRIIDSELRMASEDDSEREAEPTYEVLLGIDEDNHQIAIIGRLSAMSQGFRLQITCMAPLVVKSGVQEDLQAEDGRWQALVNYAGATIEPLWDYCRLAASTLSTGSLGNFDIPEEMPGPILIRPIERAS